MGCVLGRVLGLRHRGGVAGMNGHRCREADKTCYPSEAAASRAVYALENNGKAGPNPRDLKPYRCEGHDHWHVGHGLRGRDAPQPPRRKVRAKRATPRRRDAERADTAVWTVLNDALLNRSRGCCERCGKNLLTGGVPVSRHHRQRRRDGGDVLSNLMFLCGTGTTGCHGWITEHPTEATAPANGWIVRSGYDPADIPVRLADGYLYTLNDTGDRRLVP